MYRLLLFLISFLFFSQSFAQHNIEYKFKVRFQSSSFSWSTITVVDSVNFTEGVPYTFPSFDMSSQSQPQLQAAYNAIEGSTFLIENGALNNDIRLEVTLDGLDLTGNYSNPVNGDSLFLLLNVDVYSPADATDPVEGHFWFNTGADMVFTIPMSANFTSFVQGIGLSPVSLAFAYIANDLFSSADISTTITASSVSFRARHLSTFGGGSDNLVGVAEEINENNIPSKYILEQNYPNPFNPSTKINFGIPESGYTSLVIYNALGAKVSTLLAENISAGNYSINFNASNLPSGIYFYTLVNNNFSITKKMMLLK